MAGDWEADRRHGTGFCKFSDGTKFRGRWEEDGWMQSGADPARCKVIAAPGLSRAVAGQQASFEIKVSVWMTASTAPFLHPRFRMQCMHHNEGLLIHPLILV